MDRLAIEEGVHLILEGIGEDTSREGLKDTPRRVAQALEECLAGMDQDSAELFQVSFDADCHDIVVVRDIPFFSLCEHHLLPFFGSAHVAYIPGENGKVCGISKLARTVDVYARRLQLQERLCAQVADAVNEALHPLGVLVVMEAEHLCMTMRGVKKPGAVTTTSTVRGGFATNPTTRAEAMKLLFDGKPSGL